MLAKGLDAHAAAAAALDVDIKNATPDIGDAITSFTALAGGFDKGALCAAWNKHRNTIQGIAEFLQNGKLKLVIVSVPLPEVLRLIGVLLTSIDNAMQVYCA